MENLLFRENRMVFEVAKTPEGGKVSETASQNVSKKLEEDKKTEEKRAQEARDVLLEAVRERKGELYSRLAEHFKGDNVKVEPPDEKGFYTALYQLVYKYALATDSSIWEGLDPEVVFSQCEEAVKGEKVPYKEASIFSDSLRRNDALAEAFSRDVVEKLKPLNAFLGDNKYIFTLEYSAADSDLKILLLHDLKAEKETKLAEKSEEAEDNDAQYEAMADKMTKKTFLMAILGFFGLVPKDPSKYSSSDEFNRARKEKLLAGFNGQDPALGFVFGLLGFKCAQSTLDEIKGYAKGTKYEDACNGFIAKGQNYAKKFSKDVADIEGTKAGAAEEAPEKKKDILAEALKGAQKVAKDVAFEQDEKIDPSKQLALKIPKGTYVQFPAGKAVDVEENNVDITRPGAKLDAVMADRVIVVKANEIPAGTVFAKGVVYELVEAPKEQV